ncbi:hypothetical protein COO60DRAFT_1633216 [Scenedesmus sp. NREL 46B-D3]|nr:hypothetical protein COO60DRAFT_1633216 [Scenedesmus sp. NREL 46B-D3]
MRQVGFAANAVANATGAVMSASCWRVGVALWSQAILAPMVPCVLIDQLGSMLGVSAWVMGLVALALWWLGVVVEHVRDDAPVLRQHIKLVCTMIDRQQAAADALRVRCGKPDGHEAWDLVKVSQCQALLDVLMEHEKPFDRLVSS